MFLDRVKQVFKRENLLPMEAVNAMHELAIREDRARSANRGQISTPENSIKYMYQQFAVDTQLRSTIIEIRHMDQVDGRVKQIHRKMARDASKGGIRLTWKGKENKKIIKRWEAFKKRCHLHRRDKLKSDLKGAAKEGTLFLQWVMNDKREIVSGVRMPSETIVPNVDKNGQFKDVRQAFKQIDPLTGKVLAWFPLWQVSFSRLDPENYDDMGSMGRPYLDASRGIWKQLRMTGEDLVIRRRHRAPQKLSHVLEGADQPTLEAYEAKARGQAGEIETDFFTNKKGSVTAIEGDANLDQIADVMFLLDTFYSGSPAPKGLFGFTEGLARDILEDLKKDYFEEIDGLQDVVAFAYSIGFKLELLLNGYDPDHYDFVIEFAERKTETRNQRADLALKYQAINVPTEMVWESAGLDVTRVKAKLEEQKKNNDPYPGNELDFDEESGDNFSRNSPNVNVTPGNAPKGESATTISTRSAK